MTRKAVIAELKKTLRETLRYFAQPRGALNSSYAPGKWTMHEILVHLSDTETVLLDRLRRLAAEPNPTLMAFDQDRWAGGLFYKSRDLKVARQQFEAARRSALELARMLPASADTNTGTHSEAGARTFGQVLAHIGEHNAHHLKQIRAIARSQKSKGKEQE